jgi:hypothetical protein
MSTMSRIADYVSDICDTETEYQQTCEELSNYFNEQCELKDLSRKAFAAVMNWEDENKDVQDWNDCE